MTFSWRGDALEVATALMLAALVVLVRGTEPHSILPLYLAAVSPALCLSDVAERRLPNRLVLPGYLVAGIAIVVGRVSGDHIAVSAVIGGLGYFAFLLALAALGGMGMGDVKLAGVLGFAAGAVGSGVAVLSPLIAFVVGAVAAVVAVARRTGRSIPFGPCMLVGFWGAALFV